MGDSLGASAYVRKGGADDGGGGWVHGDSKTHAVTDGVPPIMSRHASALTLERSASGYSRCLSAVVCVYVCVYMYIYRCMCVCICIYIDMYLYLYIYIYIYIHVYVYLCCAELPGIRLLEVSAYSYI